MNPRITEPLDRIRRIEEEIEQELKRRRAQLHADFEHGRIRFERECWSSNAASRWAC
jgi:molecular chaperone GrpE (heat shock protein)